MEFYAHIDDKEKPFPLPSTFSGVYGFDCLSDATRAAYGVYPYVRDELLPGASGWGDAYLDTEAGVIRKPSLPADLDKALSDAKERKHTERYYAMLAARNGGFELNGARFESDQESRALIMGAVQLATIAIAQGTQAALDQYSATLGEGWRTASGTPTIRTAEGMVGLGMALAAHIAYCDGVSQSHRAAIDAYETADTETVATVLAYDVSAGYDQEYT